MTKNRNFDGAWRALRAAWAGFMWLAMLAAAPVCAAQEDYTIDTFDTEDGALFWSRWWGSAVQTYEFDPTVDAAGNSGSGSLKVTVQFDLAAYGGDNQFAAQRNFNDNATLNGARYTNLVFDLRWDAASPTRSSADHGFLEYGFKNADFSQTWLGGRAILASSANQWTRFTIPISPTLAKLDTITGLVLKLWSGAPGGLTGTTVFWIDNIKLIGNTNLVVPPPTIEIVKATPGLQLSASAAGQQYQRQNIRTLATDPDLNPTYYSWVGISEPVTYALTVKEFPDAAYSGFQAHVFLAPGAALPFGAGDASVDWNATNLVFVQIVRNADGTATGRFMYKINQGGGNSMLWNSDPAAGPVGTLALLSDAAARGTWRVTFRNNTDITLTTPSGSSTNFSMPAQAATLFADPLFVYVGVQPNQSANIGQSAVFGRVQITGAWTPLDDQFGANTLDPAKWQIAAADAPGIVAVPSDAVYWLRWTAPATGYVVRSSATLAPSSWADPGTLNIIQIGAQKAALLASPILPSPAQGFFRLVKP